MPLTVVVVNAERHVALSLKNPSRRQAAGSLFTGVLTNTTSPAVNAALFAWHWARLNSMAQSAGVVADSGGADNLSRCSTPSTEPKGEHCFKATLDEHRALALAAAQRHAASPPRLASKASAAACRQRPPRVFLRGRSAPRIPYSHCSAMQRSWSCSISSSAFWTGGPHDLSTVARTALMSDTCFTLPYL